MWCPTCNEHILAEIKGGKIVGLCRMCGREWTTARELWHADVRMNAARVKALKSDPSTCPFCESDRLTFDGLRDDRIDSAPSIILRDCCCEDCGHSWRLEYQIFSATDGQE